MRAFELQLSAAAWSSRVAAFLVLGALLPIALGLFPIGSGEPAFVIGMLFVLSGAWNIACLVTHTSPRLVALSFWLFIYLWCGLAPLSQLTDGVWFWPGVYQEKVRTAAAYVALVGASAWVAGYKLFAMRRLVVRPRVVDAKRVTLLCWSALATSVLALGALGVGTFFSSRRGLGAALTELAGGTVTQGQLLFALIVVPSSLGLFMLLWGKNAVGWRLTLWQKRLVWALALVVVVVANPVGNSRFLSGSILIALLVARSPRVRTTRFTRTVAVALVAATVLVFPVADFSRASDSSNSLEIRFDRNLLQGGDYDAFQQTMNGVRYVDQYGVGLGTQASGVLLLPIPRQLWGSKPEPVGVVLARDAGYEFVNLSSPAWLEGYVDFSWFGAALFGAVLGALASRLDRAYYEPRFTVWSAIAPVYIGYQLIVLRGSLMGVVAFLAVWVLLAWLVTRPSPVRRGDLTRGAAA